MHYLNAFLGFLAFLAWGGLFFVYYHERIIPWFVNKFTRDKPPKVSEENSLFGAQAPLPFRYNTDQTDEETKRAQIEAALQKAKEEAMEEEPETLPSSEEASSRQKTTPQE